MQLNTLAYEGHPITIRNDGWFNATEAAAKFAKKPLQWLRQRDTVEYLSELAASQGKGDFLEQFSKIKDLDGDSAKSQTQLLALAKQTGFVSSKTGSPENGGGTWFHPKLAVPFARSLDVKFAIWCDARIDAIISGKQDWNRMRHISVASAKLLHAVVKECRESAGKAVENHHFMTEHKLVNWLLTGKFEGLNRDLLADWQLDFIGHFDLRDSLLLARGYSYEERKVALQAEATSWKQANTHRIEAANAEQMIAVQSA